MKLDLGGQPWPNKKLSDTSLSKVEEPLELCTHLRCRRADLREVACPEAPRSPTGKRDKSRPTHRLAKLTTLELDYNEIENIDGAHFHFPGLEHLDLGFNRISSILNAEVFLGRLRVLVLRKNRLPNLRWLQGYPGERLLLAHLDVSGNLLQTISDCAELVTLEDLTSLDLSGNPLEGDLTTEAFCMLACPHLSHLNGQVVTEIARTRASRWCEESEPGFQVSEYVQELQGYYSKHGRRQEREQKEAIVASQEAAQAMQDARMRNFPWAKKEEVKMVGGKPIERRETQETVRDPYGYIKQAEIALHHLTDSARERRHVSTRRYIHSVMCIREFKDPRGRIRKLLPWAHWSQEMRRIARRIDEMKDGAA